jgi:hypothetical protein
MKHNLYHFSLWITVSIAFLLVFFSGDTIAQWGDNTLKTIMIAILFVLGYGGDALLKFLFRKRCGVITEDERDQYIQSKAIEISFIMVLLYIFILSISLYTKYEASGMMPVAWVWFIAYTLILVANVFTSAAMLVIYFRGER